jgi:hypothetical protein
MYDVSTPNFRRLIAEGKIINNPMYRETLTIKARNPVILSLARTAKVSPYPTGTLSGYVETEFTPPSPFIDAVTGIREEFYSWLNKHDSERNVAIMKAWSNVDESDLMAAASLGELPETVKWLASLFRRLISLFRSFRTKSSRLKKIKKTMSLKDWAQARSDLWMELRYAFRPFVYEMYQIAEMLDGTDKQLRNTARGYYSVRDFDSSTDNTIHHFDSIDIECEKILDINRYSQYRAGVLYEINLDEAGLASSLGLDQPFSVWWELTTLSFAIDWFFNIGDIISSLNPKAGLSPLASWCTETHVYKGVGYVNVSTTETSGNYDVDDFDVTQDGEINYVHRLKVRTPSPKRSLIPSLRINLDWAKVVDLSCIARSIYRAIK